MRQYIRFSSMILFLSATLAIAAPNDLYEPTNPSSNISLINDIEVTSMIYDLANLHSVSYSNLYVYNFTINNNHPNGFTIVISSSNNGKLKNTNHGESVDDADTINYSITTLHNVNDQINSGDENQTYWGFTSSYNHENLTVTNTSLENPITLTFSGATHGITQATRNFTYRLLISTTSKQELFNGDLTDVINIEISSIQ